MLFLVIFSPILRKDMTALSKLTMIEREAVPVIMWFSNVGNDFEKNCKLPDVAEKIMIGS